ncbi:MAG: hydroxylamine reductase [Deltaproteobacteria bacterium]|nr:hydroxylamine reductase [Deltaproteobacteria bacterium]
MELTAVKGVCGKPEDTANLQDLLIYVLRGIAVYGEKAKELGILNKGNGLFVAQALFTTITNANWDNDRFIELIKEALKRKEALKDKFLAAYREKYGKDFDEELHHSATWFSDNVVEFQEKSKSVGVLSIENEDVRSLRYLLIIGLKGIAAYADHAAILGFEKDEIYDFIMEALASTTKDLSVDDMIGLVMKAGETAVNTMALLDEAHTTAYGHPEITEVNIGVGSNPGILISGHDLKDMEELLKQTEGTGVDVYTHGEMLPAHYYPELKKYDHFVGNYGGSWWHQNKEFESFNGPILMTTNCIIPIKKNNTYQDRIFTTGMTGYPDVKHIPDRSEDGSKDFSEIIALAKKCDPPTRFVVMAGCDGRQKARNYFTEVAKALPQDAVILTAGCAKYRYNKLDLGDIGGIPRILDAGQCNDCYSLVVIALKLKEVFGLDDINDLPISFDIGWYEQKAVAVLLALLFLGVKGIRLGPTLPAFLSPNVVKVLVEKFDIKLISEVGADIAAMMSGK